MPIYPTVPCPDVPLHELLRRRREELKLRSPKSPKHSTFDRSAFVCGNPAAAGWNFANFRASPQSYRSIPSNCAQKGWLSIIPTSFSASSSITPASCLSIHRLNHCKRFAVPPIRLPRGTS